jgi:hypothetical protein
LFVEPKAITLGCRNEAQLRNGTNVTNFERKEESFYISLIKTLEIVLSDPEMADLIIYEKDEGVTAGTFSNPKHGSKYRTHPIFSNKMKILGGFNCRQTGLEQQTPPLKSFFHR